MFICVGGLTRCPYFDNGADASRDEDEQAGLLVDQIQENHDGAEASPQHCANSNNVKTFYFLFFMSLQSRSEMPVQALLHHKFVFLVPYLLCWTSPPCFSSASRS